MGSGFFWLLVWSGGLAFSVGLVLAYLVGPSGGRTAVLAAIGLVAILVWIGAVIAMSPTEPVHESVETLGRHVSPYLRLVLALNLLGWGSGVAAGWAARRAALSWRLPPR
ncbi:MAG TPA: hypothetical protein VD769_12730 [Gaiellaceae bacterium]|nr:hypothetical protein [Gaiellaceae bacterium]